MYWQKKQNKYNAQSAIVDGVAYQSKKEAAYAAELIMRQKAGDIKSWRRQIPIDLHVYGEKVCRYYMDFEITHNDGEIELVEIKGFATRIWQMKWRLLEIIYTKEHPEITLTIIR